MTKTTPALFIRQVRQEAAKVTWPSRREVMISTLMVFALGFVAALFFLLVDWVASSGIGWILGWR